MIPNLIHRIWLGSPIPEESQVFWREFRRLHPDWCLMTWRDEDFWWLRNGESFKAASQWAQKADIARYEILARYGGIYVDCDIEPMRPFEPLRDARAFVGYEERWDGYFGIGVMGCERGYPMLEYIVEHLPASIAEHAHLPINHQTGPIFFTDVVNERSWDGLVKHPPEAFYPYHWSESDPGIYPDESYAVHHWAKGWQD